MNKKNIVRMICYWFFAVVLVFVDQFSKVIAVDKLKDKESFIIWDGVFELTYVENRGAAFGSLQGKLDFFVILTVVLIPLMILTIHRINKLIDLWSDKVNVKAYRIIQLTLVLIIAGAIGNFIDRIVNGFVVDFLYFKLIDFPVFNIADCYITVACILVMIIAIFFLKEKELDCILRSQKKWESLLNDETDSKDRIEDEDK